MKAYRVVEGYIQLKFTETGEVIKGGQKFPISRFTVLVDPNDKAILEYLLNDLDLEVFELHPLNTTPHYLTHELN